MRGFRRRRRRGMKIRWPGAGLRGLVLILFGVAVLLWGADRTVATALVAIAEQEARRRAIMAIDRLVLSRINQGARPEELVIFDKDQSGRVAAYRIDTARVNEMAALGAEAVRMEFDQLVGKRFGIPLGDLTGFRFLAGTGPTIPVMLAHTGSINTELKQEFAAAGINQTRHRIWLEADVVVRVVLPLVAKEIHVIGNVPITDTVIVGPVPESFVNGPLGGVTLPATHSQKSGG
jgi:sporulation protein YunB